MRYEWAIFSFDPRINVILRAIDMKNCINKLFPYTRVHDFPTAEYMISLHTCKATTGSIRPRKTMVVEVEGNCIKREHKER